MRAGTLLAASTTLLVAACGSQTGMSVPGVQPGSSPKTFRVATHDKGPQHAAAADGILRGRVNEDGTACFWLHHHGRTVDGRRFPATSLAIVWPQGSVAYTHPLRVVDDGEVIGRIDRRIELGGGVLPRSRLPVLGCPEFKAAFG